MIVSDADPLLTENPKLSESARQVPMTTVTWTTGRSTVQVVTLPPMLCDDASGRRRPDRLPTEEQKNMRVGITMVRGPSGKRESPFDCLQVSVLF